MHLNVRSMHLSVHSMHSSVRCVRIMHASVQSMHLGNVGTIRRWTWTKTSQILETVDEFEGWTWSAFVRQELAFLRPEHAFERPEHAFERPEHAFGPCWRYPKVDLDEERHVGTIRRWTWTKRSQILETVDEFEGWTWSSRRTLRQTTRSAPKHLVETFI